MSLPPMPQMAPMNWFFLFLMFSSSVAIAAVKTHYLN